VSVSGARAGGLSSQKSGRTSVGRRNGERWIRGRMAGGEGRGRITRCAGNDGKYKPGEIRRQGIYRNTDTVQPAHSVSLSFILIHPPLCSAGHGPTSSCQSHRRGVVFTAA